MPSIITGCDPETVQDNARGVGEAWMEVDKVGLEQRPLMRPPGNGRT